MCSHARKGSQVTREVTQVRGPRKEVTPLLLLVCLLFSLRWIAYNNGVLANLAGGRRRVELIQRERLSHRRPCPPLYSGRAGYKVEILMGEKTSWPLAVALQYQLDTTRNGACPALGIFPADVRHLAILSSPGLPCRSEQSREPSSPLSIASRGRHVPACARRVPARSRHAPGTRPGLPRRIRHKLSGTPCGASCQLAILRG